MRSRKMRLRVQQLADVGHHDRVPRQDVAQLGVEAVGQVVGDAADAAVAVGQPRAATPPRAAPSSHSRALSAYRKTVNAPSSIALAPRQVRWSQMRDDLADDHADELGALGDLLVDAEQLLDRQRVADVVEHRRDVVQAVGVGEDLRPGRVLRLLLEAAVQVADLDVGAGDASRPRPPAPCARCRAWPGATGPCSAASARWADRAGPMILGVLEAEDDAAGLGRRRDRRSGRSGDAHVSSLASVDLPSSRRTSGCRFSFG